MCARTYKLLGACSCVLTFKAEFFLRNKKQLISKQLSSLFYFYHQLWKSPNTSFSIFFLTILASLIHSTIRIIYTLNKSNNIQFNNATNCNVALILRAKRNKKYSDELNVYVLFGLTVRLFYPSTGIFYSQLNIVHVHIVTHADK